MAVKPSQALKNTLHILPRGRPTSCQRLKSAHDAWFGSLVVFTTTLCANVAIKTYLETDGCCWLHATPWDGGTAKCVISFGCQSVSGKLSCTQRPQGFHLSLFEYWAPLELKTQQLELVSRSAYQWSKLCKKEEWLNEHMCSHEQYPVQPKGIEHTLTHSQAKTCSQVCSLKFAMQLQTVQATLWGCSTHQHPGQCQTPASWKSFALSAVHLLHIVHAAILSPKPMAAHLHPATAGVYLATVWQCKLLP